MSKARSSHEQKTLGDRQRYLNTTVRPKVPSPTIDEPFVDVDSTEAIPESGQRYTPTYTSKRSQSAIVEHLREKWPEVLIALVLIPILGFFAYQVYTLNREVGELRIELNEARSQHQQLQKQLERTETRLQGELDRLIDRIDHTGQSPSADHRH